METKFSVQQRLLGISECERLCARSSREVEELAHLSGCGSRPGQSLSVSVGAALNMLVLSISKSSGVEAQAMTAWLPGLRNEALLNLGEDISNWSFHGSGDEEKAFWPTLYASRDAVRPHVARLLNCSTNGTIRQFYFYSQNDVVCYPNSRPDLGGHDGPPRFVIDAHSLAEKVRANCGAPLFHAKAVNFA
jgi:hypothetical protein